MRSLLRSTLLLVLASLVPGALAMSNRFIEPQQFFIGGSAGAGVVLADFNGDGKIDMAVTHSTAASVGVLLGTGTGFAPGVSYATGDSPQGIAAADFNRDGKLDLVTANSGSADVAVSVLLGNGDGSFQTPITHLAGDGSLHVVVADFNRDGNPDVAVSSGGTQPAVTVLLGNGDGRLRKRRRQA